MNWPTLYICICFLLYFKAEGHTVKKQLAVPFMGQNEDIEQKSLREGSDGDILTTTEESKKNCMCSKIYDPVCGSDGKSYYNLCQLECENKSGRVIVQHQGNCIPF